MEEHLGFTAAHPDTDAWFWSPGHQAAEREAREDLAVGHYTDFADGEAFLAHLAELARRADDDPCRGAAPT